MRSRSCSYPLVMSSAMMTCVFHINRLNSILLKWNAGAHCPLRRSFEFYFCDIGAKNFLICIVDLGSSFLLFFSHPLPSSPQASINLSVSLSRYFQFRPI
ncbi:hypothetical protein GQ55_5G289500 [Panicum hallii var. hallii]|uniref:Uncharacterized protein n=1 Tax=Panicum hallii var. hallii TaxID=1504633 RepID=A0A2T7DLA8_9POAL|nr:hypothetical protein GQ55_5G289500 [Panicum hallii var. hallii]